jgi:hypothetical protein
MIQKIKQLESAACLLEPDASQRQQLLDQVTAYSQDYLESIAGAPANGLHSDGRDLYNSPIAEEGIPIDQALDLLRENVDTTGIGTTSGRFLGYIPGGYRQSLFGPLLRLPWGGAHGKYVAGLDG